MAKNMKEYHTHLLYSCLRHYNGDTYVTNFHNERRLRYEKAIEMYKSQFDDDSLYIKDDAFSVSGENLYPEYNSLHCTKHRNLSEFWKIYEKLKETESDE